jgi:uncharacterized membrane protein
MRSDVVVPSRVDPVVRGASTLIGGPVGRRARIGERRFFSPLMVLLMWTFATFALGFAAKAPCRDPGRWQHEFQYTRLCYSDVLALYYAEGLDKHERPYLDHKVEYPVVIGGVMFVADHISTLFADDERVQVVSPTSPTQTVTRKPPNATGFFDITAFLLLIAAFVVTATTVVAAGRRRQWDAALVALAPGLLLHGTTNWDLIAAALAGVAIACWARERPVLSGVFIALGISAKLYPVLFLVPLLFLCLRAGRMRAYVRTAAAAVVSFLVINLPFMLTGGVDKKLPVLGWRLHFSFPGPHRPQEAWGQFWSLNNKRPADWDSIYLSLQYVRDRHPLFKSVIPDFGDTNHAGVPVLLNRVTMVLIALALAGICVLIWRAPRRPRLAQVLFLSLAAFLLLNKVNSPQYTIWLIPLAVLARPKWGAFLVWQFLEIAVMFTRFYFFICNDKGGTDNCSQGLHQPWFLVSVLLRNIALAVLIGLVVREVLHPQTDVVRADGDDDPAGGVLDGAPDRSDVPVYA